jgi:hypothetical protein
MKADRRARRDQHEERQQARAPERVLR